MKSHNRVMSIVLSGITARSRSWISQMVNNEKEEFGVVYSSLHRVLRQTNTSWDK